MVQAVAKGGNYLNVPFKIQVKQNCKTDSISLINFPIVIKKQFGSQYSVNIFSNFQNLQ